MTPANAAYLVATMGVRTKGERRTISTFNQLRFRRVGTKDSWALEFSNSNVARTPIAFTTSDSMGGVLMAALRPGTYELHNVQFYFNNGASAPTVVSARQDFAIVFTLEAGQALYLGEFIAETVWRKNALGMPVPLTSYFTRTDRRERDIPLLRAADPGLSGYRVTYPDFTVLAPPFVVGPSE